MKDTTQYFGLADAAARVGISRNALKKRWMKQQDPLPDAMYNDHRPLWLADTLDRFAADRDKKQEEIESYVKTIRTNGAI